ncbi:uncharacterized protein N7482_000166 [Penicillium canariense]|uniref:DH domain-containing protein n=1 Tax=Penicillium canariense TaxID=189055 RepID=A0A9W9LSP3_9EURO|nr:uncharacterized protein N7482_000166 [Penicillium canariense]KAJ5174289.1 hypothetical protein N7482_000166 [Penicillium canariense]
MDHTDVDAFNDKTDEPPMESETEQLLAEKEEELLPLRQTTSHPFQKWMDSFRVRTRVPSTTPERYVESWSDSSPPNFSQHNLAARRDSLRSGHSSQLGTVKTTTVSITSRSFGRSRGATQSTTGKSSVSDTRDSGDSSRPTSSQHADEQADMRANKRRQVLREMLATEADYVLGLKALTEVLSMFNTRPQIYHNIQNIRKIHEHFLIQLQTISPMSSPQVPIGVSDVSRGLSMRLGGIDLPGLKGMQNRSLRARNLKATMNQRLKAIQAEPLEALKVACAVEKLSLSFFAYEEFCSNYDLFTQDLAILRRSVPNWATYDQGIEALSKSVASVESRKHEDNKSMTMSDLMIKPIQRLCKYPLLLQDLLRHTPVGDCPSSHDGIRQILESLRILVVRINSATGNPVKKDRIQKTILLQGRIEFSDSYTLQDVYQDLGPLTLCGVLHVTYQTPGHTTGEFMACVLFNCYIVLARELDDFRRLEVMACIYLDDLKEETLQNGHGLFCYGCPFSWKFQFQRQEENYEFVLSASCATEERLWKTETLKCSAALAGMAKPGGSWDPRKYTILKLPLVPLGRVQYAVASLARRSSMDSTAVTRKAKVQHVVIKKTHFPHTLEETTSPSPEGEIERPKTTAARGSLTVTARRVDRIRLERLISDVYTRDVLPLPGMVLGRGDLFRRGSIMQRLSLHATFTKRSRSVSTVHSGPVLTDAHSIDRHSREGRELVPTHDGCADHRSSTEPDRESPKTPMSTLGRSRTLRFQNTPKRASESASSPRSEKRLSQESSSGTSPLRKKWTSPISLLSALSPKNLMRPRPNMGQGNGQEGEEDRQLL